MKKNEFSRGINIPCSINIKRHWSLNVLFCSDFGSISMLRLNAYKNPERMCLCFTIKTANLCNQPWEIPSDTLKWKFTVHMKYKKNHRKQLYETNKQTKSSAFLIFSLKSWNHPHMTSNPQNNNGTCLPTSSILLVSEVWSSILISVLIIKSQRCRNRVLCR